MAHVASDGVIARLRRIAKEMMELPVLRLVTKPLYRHVFRRPYLGGNTYYGVFRSYAEAKESANAISVLPTTYDIQAAGNLYRDRAQGLSVGDYPLLYWVGRRLREGDRRIFDLGGHIGVSYYGLRSYLGYPKDMRWVVHDVPAVIEAGRSWAAEHDHDALLGFADTPQAASGSDLLISSGALQYLDYSLPELLGSLQRPPPHVLVNLTPMHPQRSFFTLQNLDIAICPYRVMSLPEFIAGMEGLGYHIVDQWQSFERSMRVPFEPGHGVDCYSGFYFRHREAGAMAVREMQAN